MSIHMPLSAQLKDTPILEARSKDNKQKAYVGTACHEQLWAAHSQSGPKEFPRMGFYFFL